MNRAERLRRELPQDMKGRAAELAGLPVAQVDLIVSALRASHRAGREHERAQRRQRRQDRREHHHVEDAQQAAATDRQTLALARRAGSNLDTLARLQDHYDDGPAVLAMAVEGCRAQGYSDGEIGAALGITRQAVGQRFGRKGTVHASTGGA